MAGLSANTPSDQSPDPSGPPDTSKITQLIQHTRVLLKTTWLATGVGVTVGLLLATLVVVTLTDLVVYTLPSWLRLTGFLCVVIPTVWVCYLGVIRPLFRRLTEVIVARHIEREIPGIHNRLVSCIDLSRNGDSRKGLHSQAFHVRLVDEALKRIADFSPRKVLDLLSLRRSAIFAAVASVALILAFVVFSDRLSTAVARIVYFYRDIPPNSGVGYQVVTGEKQEPGNDQKLRGENVHFTVTVTKGSDSALLERDALTLEVETTDEDGAPKKLVHDFPALIKVETSGEGDQLATVDQTSFSLVGMQRDFRYRVRGGQTWTPQYQVTMLERPRIVNLQTELSYPEYMKITEPRLGAPQTKDVTGPKGSKVKIIVDVEGDTAGGEIVLLEPRLTRVAVTDRPERIWFSDALPEGATVEGTWQWDDKAMGHKGHFDAPAAGPHAHGFTGVPVGYLVQPDEVLFVNVRLIAGQVPEQIMLEWHDGENWEHRAFWGADKIAEGTLGSPSRRSFGKLPEAGRVVQLEIPTDLVGLTGKRLQGMRFRLVGGHCIWGATGTLPPTARMVRVLTPTDRFLVKQLAADADSLGDRSDRGASGASAQGSGSDPLPSEPSAEQRSRWAGEFSLLKDGFYRVELYNQAGDKNQQMEEGKLEAIIDQSPWVDIERPGMDLVVSAPVKVNIHLRASDDYGIDQIELAVQKGEEEPFQGRLVQRFDQPPRSVTRVVTLDLAEEELAVGQSLKYRVVVRDGKPQSATSRDFTIRLADESQAADKTFQQYEQQTDTFREKLIKLIAEQEKIRETSSQLVEKYQPLTEKLEAAAAEAQEKVDPADPQAKPAPLELDEEATKEHEALRGELTQLAADETKNVELGQQVANDLKQLSEQANTQAFLPPEITRQLAAMQEAFQNLAVEPMQQLANQAQAAAQPQQTDPQLENIERQSEQLQKNLDDLQKRLESLADAQAESRLDVDTALSDLRSDLMQQDAQLTASDLSELRDFLEAKRADLEALQGNQEELLEDATKDLSERGFDAIKEEQEQLDSESEDELADVRDLLEQLRSMRQPPRFPGRPYDPERDSYLVPPKELDTAAEPEDGEKNEDQPEQEGEEDAEEFEEEPELFLPALGGPVPKMDPRFAEKLRDLKEQMMQAEKNGEGEEERQQMRSRQFGRVEELDQAQRALGADKDTLDQMLEQLENLANQPLTPSQMNQLEQMMQSQDMQSARSMLQRLQQMLSQSGQSQTPPPDGQQPQPAPPPPPSTNQLSESTNATAVVDAIVEELGAFDVRTRTVIIGMQKRQREDLLQSLKKGGPEGYREFVREYFRKLSKVQAPKK